MQILTKNIKEMANLFLFGHNFLPDANFEFLPMLVIYIYHALSIDTNMTVTLSGYHGYFDRFGYYGSTLFGRKYGRYWCQLKEQEKCGSHVKLN